MTEQLSDYQANPTPDLVRLYEGWSLGGSGLLITGNIMVDRRYKEGPYNLVLDEYSDLEKFRELAAASQQHEAVCWAQLSHAGRQAMRSSSSSTICPSNTPMYSDSNFMFRWLSKIFFAPVREMSEREIHMVINQFVTSAKLAKAVGFSGVQFHSAHGYLLSQFLSPNINKREDQWGGSLENRSRLLLTIVEETREAVGKDFAISIKLNSSDFTRNGFSYEDSTKLIIELSKRGVDLIEISGGNYESLTFMLGKSNKENENENESESEGKINMTRGDAYFLDFAEKLKNELKGINLPIMLTGGFRKLEGMEYALEQNLCQVIGMARPLALDPQYSNRLLGSSNLTPYQLPTLPNFKVLSFWGIRYLSHLFSSSLSLSYYMYQIKRNSKGMGNKELGIFSRARNMFYYTALLYFPRFKRVRPY